MVCVCVREGLGSREPVCARMRVHMCARVPASLAVWVWVHASLGSLVSITSHLHFPFFPFLCGDP